MSLIELKNICKNYHTDAGEVPTLKNINLAIENRDFVAIMGASGSGKSTMMNIVGCLDKASSGEYLIEGKNSQELSKDELATLRNKTIGFVFQGFNLLPRMDLLNNVALPLIYSGVSTYERFKAAESALDKVGLKEFKNRFPNQISGVQQQRVAIARALVTSPRIILADEPTGNLDTKMTKDIMELFTNLNKNDGITVILITHEPEVAHYAHKVVKIMDGQVVSYEVNL